MTIQRYPYRLHSAVVAGGAALLLYLGWALLARVLAGAEFAFYGARLDGPAARWGNGALALFFGLLAAGLVRMQADAFRQQPDLELRPDVLRVPESLWRRRPTDIPYDRITRLRRMRFRGQRLLYVYADRNVSIAASLLPNAAAYETVVQELARRAPGAEVG